MKRMISLLVALGCVGAFVGCGPSFEATPDPEFEVEGASNQVVITQMGPFDRDRTLGSLSFRNVGEGELRITNWEWVERPSRLNAFYEGDLSTGPGECTRDADCGGEAVCLTASGSCRDLGLPPTPVEVRSGALYSLSFVVTAGDQAVQCPQPPADTPAEVQNRYCGELIVETNAANSTALVEEGRARIFFVTDGTSGLMAIPETFLSFTEVEPGGTYSRNFTINNQDSGPLTVERAQFSELGDWFEISPPISNTVIDGNDSRSFTLQLSPPEDAEIPVDGDLSTVITFESTTSGTAPSLFVEITGGVGDVALIEVDPLSLSFAESTSQPLEVRNVGGGSLIVQSMTLEPSSLADRYRVTFGGDEVIGSSGSITTLAPGVGGEPTVADFTVTFDDPDDGSNSVGFLRISHNDSRSENPVRVALLGGETEVALGELGTQAMRQVLFVSDGGEQVRRFPLINTGNTDLEITDVIFDDSQSNTDAADYQVDGLMGTLAPGEIREVTLTYAGESQFPQSLGITVESNHAGDSSSLALNVSAQTGQISPLELTITPSFSTSALVGQMTTFTVSGDGGEANLNNSQWFTLQRPAGAESQLQVVGEEAAFVPDVAGTYRIGVQVRDNQSRDVQQVLEFTASE